MDEQNRLREIKFYKRVIFAKEHDIAREKEGLILNSGMIRSDIVNVAAIRELESKLMK